MDDLISREDAICSIKILYPGRPIFKPLVRTWEEKYEQYIRAENEIRKLPSAEPERKKGKWTIERMNTYELSYGTTAYEPVYRCSACGISTESYLRLDEPIMPEDADFPKFCPNCGADMRESEG